MKRSTGFLNIVVSLLLLSSVILTGCMYAIASNNGGVKPYDLNVQKKGAESAGGSIVEDAPFAQAPMLGKFGEYVRQEGKTVTIFTEEQYTELKAIRDSGKRNPLTYEEILFLVNDSVSMYFSYDEIRLFNANIDNVLPLTLNFASIQSSSSCIISPYHGDFSEYESYTDALSRYDRMIEEIYAIVYYRIYMHDAGFAGILRCYDEIIKPSERESFYDEYGDFNGGRITNAYQLLTIDGSAVGGSENEEKIAREFGKIAKWDYDYYANHVDPDKIFEKTDAPVLCTETWNDQSTPLEYQFYICESNEMIRVIYPTKELRAIKPQSAVTYQAGEEGAAQPIVRLSYLTGLASISGGIEFSSAVTGPFRLEDGVLKIYFGEDESDPDYWYVFYETEDAIVYSAENSKPSAGLVSNWDDGLVFRKYREYVEIQNGIIPPHESDDVNPDSAEEGQAYLKYDSDSSYCSLMSSQGISVVDGGSYAEEDERLVFLFKTSIGLYQYCFDYRGGNLYSYLKGQSNPVPGYEFEDETQFILTVFDTSSSCLLEVKKD